ncbi:MAG: DUF1501 domain-containing protein [Candidatus Kapaibacteriales bacterium]
MKRRSFISGVGASVVLPAVLGGARVSKSSPYFNNLAASSPLDNENILVLIQLNGGNDGLNTLVPLEYYDQLAKARSSVIVPKNELLQIENDAAMHPSMKGLYDLYKDEKVSIVESVGYPDPNLSHFRSTDIWTSGSGSDKTEPTGWLGRFLSTYHTEYPQAYPTPEFPDPLSLTLGSLVSTTCQGYVSTMGLAFNSFEDFYALTETGYENLNDTFAADHIRYINQLIEKTNVYTETLEAARDAIPATNVEYPDTRFGGQMKSLVHLINAGLKTKVYVISISGFDTHANQVETENESQGLHYDLLSQVSDSISAAMRDLQRYENDKKVLFMTFSEFGRRIIQNASVGTDHGEAAPMIFAGTQVDNRIFGDMPVIPDNPERNENVPMQFDYRAVYYSVLKDWFDVPEEDFESMGLSGFDHIPIIKKTSSVNEEVSFATGNIYPNPASSHITLKNNVLLSNESIITINDMNGRQILSFVGGNMSLNIQSLSNGNYYVLVDGKPFGRFIKN